MSKDAFYFSHDSNASQDPKILQMCSVYKAEGYGWYWMIIEMMREQEDYKLLIKGKYAFHSLAIRSYADTNTFVSFIEDCVSEFNLFSRDENYLWSNSLIKRMEIKNEKSKKAKESIAKRWEKSTKTSKESVKKYGNNTNVCKNDTNVSEIDTIKERKEKKVKEIKEIKEEEEKEEEKNLQVQKFPEKNVVSFFETEGFGTLSPSIANQIITYSDEGIGDAIVILALKEAVNYNKRSWAYARSCLDGWKSQGYKTEQQVLAHLVDRKNKKTTYQDKGKESSNVFDEIGKERGYW